MELRPLKGWKINADFAYNVYNQEISEVEKYIYTYDINNQPYENGISIPNNLTRKKYIKNIGQQIFILHTILISMKSIILQF